MPLRLAASTGSGGVYERFQIWLTYTKKGGRSQTERWNNEYGQAEVRVGDEDLCDR